MKQFPLYALILSFLLYGCVRPASVAVVTEEATPLPSPTPGAGVFPLTQGTTWIYEYTSYNGDEAASWRVSETVAASKWQGAWLVALVERKVQLMGGSAGALDGIPPEGTYYLLFDGSRLFIQNELDLENVENARLDLVYPSVSCWFESPIDREQMPTPEGVDWLPGCRRWVGDPQTVETPAGTFEGCLEAATPYNNGPIFATFCPRAGWVRGSFDHVGSPFGYEFVMTGYFLPP